jgi:fructose-bisphosphate aldolase class I
MNATTLDETVAALLAPGKGILAADESLPTIGKRFTALAIPTNESNRRAYRELLFTTPGLSEFISGAILFDETINQTTAAGQPMPELLRRQGIIPGIKVDAGTVALPNFPEEKMTLGLDGLRERLAKYREQGARFTKWRAVIQITDRLPTFTALATNAETLAIFASLSQEAGLVPIVEPEVLMDGTHSIDRCAEVTEATLDAVVAALNRHRVSLERMLLKSGMVLSGQTGATQADDAQVALATLRCFRRAVPAAVPGIVFLSGGQKDLAATARLTAICKAGPTPWKLSFSFGRALQDAAMGAWKGIDGNIPAAQAALHRRARGNSRALQGDYSPALE